MLGWFISADTLVPEPGNPQSLNRYAYVTNNPLKYVDPAGRQLKPPTTCGAICYTGTLGPYNVESRVTFVSPVVQPLTVMHEEPAILRDAVRADDGVLLYY